MFVSSTIAKVVENNQTGCRVELTLSQADAKTNDIYKIAIAPGPVDGFSSKIRLTTKKWAMLNVQNESGAIQQVLVNINSLAKRLGISKEELRLQQSDVTGLVNTAIGHREALHKLGFTASQIRYVNKCIQNSQYNHLSSGRKNENGNSMKLPHSVTIIDGEAFIHNGKIGHGTSKVAEQVINWKTLEANTRLIAKQKNYNHQIKSSFDSKDNSANKANNGPTKPELDSEIKKINRARIQYELEIRKHLKLEPNKKIEGLVTLKSYMDVKHNKTGFMVEHLPLGFEDICGADAKIHIPLHVKVSMMRQVAGGLAYMHKQGVVHLDLKPANIRGTYDPLHPAAAQGKLGDFDLSLVSTDRRNEKYFSRHGTPLFKSPEQNRLMMPRLGEEAIDNKITEMKETLNQLSKHNDPRLTRTLQNLLDAVNMAKFDFDPNVNEHDLDTEVNVRVLDLETEVAMAKSLAEKLLNPATTEEEKEVISAELTALGRTRGEKIDCYQYGRCLEDVLFGKTKHAKLKAEDLQGKNRRALLPPEYVFYKGDVYKLKPPSRIVVHEGREYDLKHMHENEYYPEPVQAMWEISQLIDQLQSIDPTERPSMEAVQEKLASLESKIADVELKVPSAVASAIVGK